MSDREYLDPDYLSARNWLRLLQAAQRAIGCGTARAAFAGE